MPSARAAILSPERAMTSQKQFLDSSCFPESTAATGKV